MEFVSDGTSLIFEILGGSPVTLDPFCDIFQTLPITVDLPIMRNMFDSIHLIYIKQNESLFEHFYRNKIMYCLPAMYFYFNIIIVSFVEQSNRK